VYGSLSMTSYTLDGGRPEVTAMVDEPAAIPDPEFVPADETNI